MFLSNKSTPQSKLHLFCNSRSLSISSDTFKYARTTVPHLSCQLCNNFKAKAGAQDLKRVVYFLSTGSVKHADKILEIKIG